MYLLSSSGSSWTGRVVEGAVVDKGCRSEVGREGGVWLLDPEGSSREAGEEEGGLLVWCCECSGRGIGEERNLFLGGLYWRLVLRWGVVVVCVVEPKEVLVGVLLKTAARGLGPMEELGGVGDK